MGKALEPWRLWQPLPWELEVSFPQGWISSEREELGGGHRRGRTGRWRRGSIPAMAQLASWALPGQARVPEPFLLFQDPQKDSLLSKGGLPVYRPIWEEGFSLRWAQTCFSLSLVI